MYTKITRIALAMALLTLPAALAGCGGSTNSAQSQTVTSTPTQSPTATSTQSPTATSAQSPTATSALQVEGFSVKDQTLEYLEHFGTNTWNSGLSKDLAEKIRVIARESNGDKYTYLEIADSIEKDDIQSVKKLYTKIGGIVPASVESRYPDTTLTSAPTEEPPSAESDANQTYADYDQKNIADALATAKLYLDKGIPDESKDDALEIIFNASSSAIKEHENKFKEMGFAIQKDDRASVKKLYDELLKLYSGKQTTAVKTTATPETAAAPDDIIHLKGKSDQATDFFNLKSGIAIVEATDAGDSNFVIYLYDETGASKEMLVNEIGPYKGKSLVVIPEDGKYMLNVDSDGSWKAEITQSIPDNIKSAPTKLSGKGNDVVFAKLQSKLTKFTSKHVGESNFVVKVNDSFLLVNEIGNYSGSTAEAIKSDGVYVFAVEADGPWSIEIE
ncbi:hypothetical protein [Paenibacillus sp. MMS20-IR301]|uniref:hypothetical protein n=1 Tax=Paenibacillus sp. MMS20-IR301 TaxID=2895946 RepID=UPI0028EFB3A1|nr:hypothetical protein [Paenibacillus sp. MMS20-IR301]WNS45831.1 hypothetical protein LOS79_11345 [Paenibacillus sp. MMS20-IR301]